MFTHFKMQKLLMIAISLFFISTANAVTGGLYSGTTSEGYPFWVHVNQTDGINWYSIKHKVYNEYGSFLYISTSTSYSMDVFTTVNGSGYFQYTTSVWENIDFSGTFTGSDVTGDYYWDNDESHDTEKTTDNLTWQAAATPPTITISQQPDDTTTTAGSTVEFSVTATFTSSSNGSYQWYKNNGMISSWDNHSASTSTLELSNVQMVDNGSEYSCYLYSNEDGLLISESAALTVTPSPDPGDINTDGVVDLADIITALLVITDSLPDGQQLDPAAAIAPNGTIGMTDAVFILNLLSE